MCSLEYDDAIDTLPITYILNIKALIIIINDHTVCVYEKRTVLYVNTTYLQHTDIEPERKKEKPFVCFIITALSEELNHTL